MSILTSGGKGPGSLPLRIYILSPRRRANGPQFEVTFSFQINQPRLEPSNLVDPNVIAFF